MERWPRVGSKQSEVGEDKEIAKSGEVTGTSVKGREVAESGVEVVEGIGGPGVRVIEGDDMVIDMGKVKNLPFFNNFSLFF